MHVWRSALECHYARVDECTGVSLCTCGGVHWSVTMHVWRSALECHYAREDECTGLSLCTCGGVHWSVTMHVCGIVGLLLFDGLAIIVYFITVSNMCLVTKEILLISWFLNTFVHLQLSVLDGVCLVKLNS